MDAGNIDFVETLDSADTVQTKALMSRREILLLLAVVTGTILGSVVSVKMDLFENTMYTPKIFSGLPVLENGMASCLAAFLCSAFISMTLVLILGISVFGIAVIPAYMIIKGMLTAMRIIFCFQSGELASVAECAVIYTPFLAINIFMLVLFASRAMELSYRFAGDERRENLKNADIWKLIKIYCSFLLVLVVSSIICLALVFAYSLIK